MLGSNFYWNLLRKYALVFASIFDDIQVGRFDAAGNIKQDIAVPIKFAGKSPYIQMLNRNQESTKVAIQLPTMSFALVDLRFDDQRKISPIGKHINVQPSNSSDESTQYFPMPYKVFWELYIMTKNHNDMLQIIEQIIPFFTPSISFTAMLVPEMNIARDLKILINGVTIDDIADGAIDEGKVLTATLSFVMDCWFFGPMDKGAIIKKMNVNFHVVPGNEGIFNVENYQQYNTSESVSVQPGLTANGQPTSNASLSLPYTDIQANSNYGFITIIDSNPSANT